MRLYSQEPLDLLSSFTEETNFEHQRSSFLLVSRCCDESMTLVGWSERFWPSEFWGTARSKLDGTAKLCHFRSIVFRFHQSKSNMNIRLLQGKKVRVLQNGLQVRLIVCAIWFEMCRVIIFRTATSKFLIFVLLIGSVELRRVLD